MELANIAARTTGFSGASLQNLLNEAIVVHHHVMHHVMPGASLQNLLNEAAIVAARRNKTAISYDEVDYAIDRLTVGMQKTSGTSFDKNQKLVAYHEAGKAVMALVTPDYDTVTKVAPRPCPPHASHA